MEDDMEIEYGNDDYYEDESSMEPPDIAELGTFQRSHSIIYLQMEDIKKIIDKKIDSASELLGCTYDEALILYHHFKWNKDSLENSSWFENSDKVRQKAGLPLTTMKRATAFNVQQLSCPICLASVTISECDWLPCNHVVCKFCWQAFVSDKVTDKATEFFWNCPGEQGKKMLYNRARLL